MPAGVEIIQNYFPDLTERQLKQFAQMADLYRHWNSQINVISRKDIDELYERHVLHSLGIAQVIQFKDKTKILDIGTGGGFPGIPLAVLFPNCQFHLVDSIGKKIKVVNEVAAALELENVTAEHQRAEKVKSQYDFIVSRAVTALPKFMAWTRGKIRAKSFNDLPNGILYLKGGDISEEIARWKKQSQVFPLSDYFEEEFFETKKVVYLNVSR